MNITVIGGGNMGTLMAASFANKGHNVTIQTSRPNEFSNTIKVYNKEEHLLYTGDIKLATDNYQTSISNAKLIWVVVPPQLFASVADKIFPYVKNEQFIGIVPGEGCAEYAFKELICKGVNFFGLARVPDIARLKKYGNSVYSLGLSPELLIGSIPSSNAPNICKLIQPLFSIQCKPVDSYLPIALTISNPLLHPTRIYSLFKDYTPGKFYPTNELFYEKWSDEAGELLLNCSDELQFLCKALPKDMRDVQSMQSEFQIRTGNELAKKIQGIERLKGLRSPVIKKRKGYIPDFNSRYFLSDFSLGIKFYLDVAKLFDTPCSTMQTIWDWYKKLQPEKASTYIKLPTDRESFLKLYE